MVYGQSDKAAGQGERMTGVPTLDALQNAEEAAWLWDGARARIVWANLPGIAFFGGESLFDLIDRRFDRSEPGVARIVALAGELLRPGQSAEEILTFPSSQCDEPVACLCYHHRLPDGRNGVLVVALPTPAGEQAPPPELAGSVLEALPHVVMTLDRDGRTLHANAPASELLADARRRGLAELLGDDRQAARFIERVVAAGIFSEVRLVETRYGQRQLRLEGRRIGPRSTVQGGTEAYILLLVEDIAERRALERSLQEDAARLADFVAAAADFTFELDRTLTWRTLSADFSRTTGLTTAAVLGRSWSEVAAAFGFDRDGRIAQAMAEGRSWRASIDWQVNGEVIPTCLSAVAVDPSLGGDIAYRGIGARLDRNAPSKTAELTQVVTPLPTPAREQVQSPVAQAKAPQPAAAPVVDRKVQAPVVPPAQPTAPAAAPIAPAVPSGGPTPTGDASAISPAAAVTAAAATVSGEPAPAAATPLPERAAGPAPRAAARPALSPEDAAAFDHLARRLIQDMHAGQPAAPADQFPAPAATEKGAIPAVPAAPADRSMAETATQEATVAEAPVTAPRLDQAQSDALAIAIARQLISGSKTASLIHRDGVVLVANQAAADVLHHDSPESLEVAGLDTLLPDWRLRGEEACVVTPEGRVATCSITARTLDWPGGPVRQLVFTPRNTPLPDRNSLSEDVWAPSDATLRTILETATDGIIILERDGTIRSFNAGAQAIFGYEAREAVGRPIGAFLNSESAKTVKDYLDAMADGSLAPIFNDGREVTGIERHGREIPLFLTISAIEQGNGYCAVLRDITHWKKAEADLRAAKDEAERSSAQKSEFLANISHELRTPLNAILGFSEVMKSERFGAIRNEKYMRYIGDIHSSGEHLLSLINDLLDLSKVEAGKLELDFTSVDLVELVDQCTHIMQDQAREARVLMRTSIPAKLPPIVADQRSMRQIILNLLSNAIKFTEPGGQVIVSLVMTPAGEVKLTVKDTGIGMTDEELAEAMKPFQRVDRRRKNTQGTGLGLPLTKALTEANRASFSITSRPESGTLVEITFPTTRVLAE